VETSGAMPLKILQRHSFRALADPSSIYPWFSWASCCKQFTASAPRMPRR